MRKRSSLCSTGAAEDGRAPTEELWCVKGWGFCSTEAVEDGRDATLRIFLDLSQDYQAANLYNELTG